MRYAFDIEIYKNFFSVIFVNVDNNEDTKTFVIFGKKDDRRLLKEFVQGKVLIGFNNLYFDNPVICSIIYGGATVRQTWELSQKIIKREDIGYKLYNYRDKETWESIDLMKVMAFDRMGIGLKRVAINMRWHKIQDLPIPFDKKIKKSQVPKLLKYNLNDALITKAMFWYPEVQDEINLRDVVGEKFGVDLKNTSRSSMGNRLLENFYSKSTGLSHYDFKLGRTPRSHVYLKDCVGKNIKFKSDELKGFLADLKDTIIYADGTYLQLPGYKIKEPINKYKFKFSRIIKYADKIFDFGVGGLHSKDNPNIFESDEDYIIIDCDVDSFYPYIMILNKIKPLHLLDNFLDIFRTITEERIRAKANGNKAKADGLKITINAVFGKLRFDSYWLYDPQAFYSVTISGQLYLLMLIECLYRGGFDILSANTDGIMCKVPRKKFDKYKSVCQRWEKKTGFSLSYTHYKRYIGRDVNNYLAIKEDGKEKSKGIFERNPHLGQGFKQPIVAKALGSYFIDNAPIEDTIKNGDIHDFLSSQKVSRGFEIIFQNSKGREVLQKTNRFYVSVGGGQLFKIKDGKKIIISSANVRILNDVCGKVKDIDYRYYIDETQKIINKVEPKPSNIGLF